MLENMEIKQTKIRKSVKVDFRRSISEIAKEVGVSRQTVWNWKKGKSFPTPAHLKRLEEIGA